VLACLAFCAAEQAEVLLPHHWTCLLWHA
jgi:hypothetical protein